MNLEEIKKQMATMSEESLRESARAELSKRDPRTLIDICLAVMNREQLEEWVLPSLCEQKNTYGKLIYGKLTESAVKRLLPDLGWVDGLLKVALKDSAVLSHRLFTNHRIRLVTEGLVDDSILVSVHAPVVEKTADAKPDEKLDAGPVPPAAAPLDEKDKPAETNEKETRDYKISGLPKQLDDLEKLFAWIQMCGSVGHSGAAQISVDGDGSAQLKFQKGEQELEVPEDMKDIERSADGPEYRVGIN